MVPVAIGLSVTNGYNPMFLSWSGGITEKVFGLRHTRKFNANLDFCRNDEKDYFRRRFAVEGHNLQP